MDASPAASKLHLRRYAQENPRAGIAGYAELPQGLAIEFGDGHVYLYNSDCPGRFHVEHMKALVTEAQRLGTYITRHVGKRYAARLR